LDLDIVPVPDAEGFYTYWIAIQRETTEKQLDEENYNCLTIN